MAPLRGLVLLEETFPGNHERSVFPMLDVLFITGAVAFFAVSWLLVRAADRM